MKGRAPDKCQDRNAAEEKGRGEEAGPREPQGGKEQAPASRPGAGRPPASSPCLLDDDDPQIDPDYLGRG